MPIEDSRDPTAQIPSTDLQSLSEDGLAAEPLPGGGRIGPYRIVGAIGRGGMGAVYLAARADDQFQKQVAIKLIKRGLDSDEIVARFRHERQILANLDHPNIARLLDGGTTEDGVPYFVMERIDGIPIERYCQERGLRTRARLRLFQQVLAAVHYAHQNLVVHRDLKPGNILVTADGTPKLLDFGIAKLLNREPGATQTLTSLRLMTPDYASPEQVRGETITTASDIYSLGVILYELLTGSRPYRVQGLPVEVVERVVCREDPARPSLGITRPQAGTPAAGAADSAQLRRELRGDLDNIVLMAMRKEPPRRYASVAQFSEDIRRTLDGLPVIARPDTWRYRTAKFIQRHKGAVAAVALIAASLMAGLVTTVWQARVARREKARAERRFNDVRRLAHSFLFEIHDAIQDLAGSTRARELVVTRGLQYLDSLAAEAGGDDALQSELAAAYVKVGDVQGRPGFANLGDRAGALASYGKAVALFEAVAVRRGAEAETSRELASAHERVGDTLRLTGAADQALESYRRALALRSDAGGSADARARRDLASSHQRIAEMQAATGDAKGAERSQRESLAHFEALAVEAPADPPRRRDLFIALVKSGDRLRAGGDAKGAVPLYRRALDLASALSEGEPTNARARRELAVAHDKVGNALDLTGDREGALGQYRAALALRAALAAADAENAELRRDLSVSHEKIGEHFLEKGDFAAALESFRRSLAFDQGALETDSGNVQARLDVSTGHENLGRVQAASGRLDEARSSYERAREMREAIATADSANVEVRRSLAELYARLGQLYAARAERPPKSGAATDWRQARAWYERAQAGWREIQSRGDVPPADEIERLGGEIARCDAALGTPGR